MEGLLQYSIERIDSLQMFYLSEQKAIIHKSAKGKNPNRFGFLIDAYFQLLLSSDEQDRNTESFRLLKERVDNYVEVISIKSQEDGERESITYRIKKKDELKARGFELNISKAVAKYKKYADMPKIHGSSTLAMLITRFEEFMSNYLTELYIRFPHSYIDNVSIAFSDICHMDTVSKENIRNMIVLREIDSKMRESYVNWFKIIDSHHLNYSSCEEELGALKEIYARRNIIVHNSGIVNETYLKNVPDTPYQIGTYLSANEEYLNNAFDKIKTIIYSLCIAAAKIIESDKAAYLYAIFETAFEDLKAKKYCIAQNVFQTLSNNKYVSEDVKVMSKINCWIAKKEMQGLDSIRNDVTKFDVSALDRSYELAKEVLLENYDAVNSILEKMIKFDNFPVSVIDDWPLFLRYRNTEHYAQFVESHPDDFSVASLEVVPDTHAANKVVEGSIKAEIMAANLPNTVDAEDQGQQTAEVTP